MKRRYTVHTTISIEVNTPFTPRAHNVTVNDIRDKEGPPPMLVLSIDEKPFTDRKQINKLQKRDAIDQGKATLNLHCSHF